MTSKHNLITFSLKHFVNSLDSSEKDKLYCYLQSEHVYEDVLGRLADLFDDLTDDERTRIAENATNDYVYNCNYDCNLSYWDNIDNLINIYRETWI